MGIHTLHRYSSEHPRLCIIRQTHAPADMDRDSSPSSSTSASASAETTPELTYSHGSPTTFFKPLEPELEADSSDTSTTTSTSGSSSSRHHRRRTSGADSGTASPPRAHFRRRDDCLQVWVCSNEPSSPLVTPSLEKQERMELERKGYTFSHHSTPAELHAQGHPNSFLSSKRRETGPHAVQQPLPLPLAHRPAFVHSETVPDVRLDPQDISSSLKLPQQNQQDTQQ